MLHAFAGIVLLAQAQTSTALRYIVAETGKTYEKPGLSGFNMGLGVDRTFNAYLTVGLDFTFDLAGLVRSQPVAAYHLETAHYTSQYTVHPRMLGLTYHTEFALGDDDGAHAYVGTFFGFKHITQEWRVDGYSTSGYYDPYDPSSPELNPGYRKVKANVFPVGLRLGVRGATDGGFADLYGMLGYQIGGGKKMLPEISAADAKYLKLSNLAFTIGFAYGIGW